MKKLLIVLLLLNGCATSDLVIDRAESVKIGDTYDQMVNKLTYEPNSIRCFRTNKGERCKAIYNLFGIYYIYSFDEKDVLTSIYR